MKTPNRSILISLCVAGLLGSTAALALDTTTVTVSATVTGTCRFNSGGSVAFTLDPASDSDASGVVVAQPELWCTKGTSYTITDDNGLHGGGTTHQMQNTLSSTDYIPYSFTYTSTGTGGGKNSPITLDIAADVVNTAFVDAPEGDYADTVTLTINP